MTHSEQWRAEHRDTHQAEHMEVWAVGGVGEVEAGTDLGVVLGRLDLHDGDVVSEGPQSRFQAAHVLRDRPERVLQGEGKLHVAPVARGR